MRERREKVALECRINPPCTRSETVGGCGSTPLTGLRALVEAAFGGTGWSKLIEP